MNEELKIIIKAVTDEARKSIEGVRKELEDVKSESKKAGASFGTAMKGIAKGAAIAVAAIAAIGAALVALGKKSLEYNRQQAKLVTGFQAAGLSAQQAAASYNGLYRFLGDSGKAVEAAAHLAKLTQNEKNLAEWAKIAQGIYATFGDSIAIEGLTESANETARVAKLTGTLTDALNWAGVSEDAFNAKLAQTNSLEEREALIRGTLNGLYSNAAEIYEINNKALLEYNESQAKVEASSGKLGQTVYPLMTALNNLSAALLDALKPALEKILPYIVGFVMWLTEAVNRVAAFFGIVSSSSKSVESVGTKTSKALEKTKSGAGGVVTGLNNIKKAAEEARKAAMGFDELNIVPSNKSSAGISGSTGALDNLDFGGAIGNIDGMAGTLDEFKTKAEEVKNNISAWMDEWGWVLGTIGGILAALSIKNLLIQLGTAIGLGEKFAKVLSFSGLAGIFKRLVGWFGAVIALMKEGNGFFAVMGAAFPKIAGWLGKIGAAIKGFTFGGLLESIKGVAAKFGWIGLIVAAVISAITYAIKYWEEIVTVFKNFIADTIAPQLEKIKNLFGEMGRAITSAIPESWIEWIKGAIQWLGNAFTVLWDIIGGTVFHTVVGAVMSALNGIISAIKGVVEVLTGVVQIVVGTVEALIKSVVAIFTGNWGAVMAPLYKIRDGIVNVFKGLYDATIGVVVEFVKGIISWFTELWDVLVGHSIVPDTVNAIIQWFLELPARIFDIVAGFVKGVISFFADLAAKLGNWAVTIWNNIKAPFVAVGNWFGDTFSKAYTATTDAFKNAKAGFANVWGNIKAGFGNVSDWFRTTFTNAWTAVKNVFSHGGKIFDGIKDGILDGLKAVINALITGINKVIAVPFDGINWALNKIKGISIVGIKPFDWITPISVPQIPKLAKGGVVDEATLAVIGEKGREAVVPLENNTEWMDKFIDKLLAKSNGNATIVLQVGETELGRAAVRGINSITRQTGKIPLLV